MMQFAELAELGALDAVAGWGAGDDRPRAYPMHEIEMNKKEQELCDDVSYILGPVVMDCAPGLTI